MELLSTHGSAGHLITPLIILNKSNKSMIGLTNVKNSVFKSFTILKCEEFLMMKLKGLVALLIV